MKKGLLYICLFGLLIVATHSCKRLSIPSFGKGELLAQVGDNELYISDVKGVFYAGISEKDSVDLLHNYVNRWTKSMIKIEKAKEQFADEDKDIEQLINTYRNSLLINKYDNFHGLDIDTTVTKKQIITHYDTNKELFKLSNPIVRAKIIIFPKNYKGEKELLKLVNSDNDNDRTDFLELVEKHEFSFIEFIDWTHFMEVIKHIPFKDKMFDDFLRKNRDYEVIDDENKHILLIDSYRNTGDLAPINMVSKNIENMIINNRRTEKLKQVEDSIYNEAIREGVIILNQEDN